MPCFDGIRSAVIMDTPCEIVEEHTKHFTIEDLTHQVLGNRDSSIGSDQESLEKIGRWGECNSFVSLFSRVRAFQVSNGSTNIFRRSIAIRSNRMK